MDKRVTIKDIARELGVSTGTVHRALYGKKGVSKDLQEKILTLCTERGYSANTVASALRRGTIRIVAAFPHLNDENRFFYSDVWRGFRRRINELRDYNLDVVELTYLSHIPGNQADVLKECLVRYDGQVDGLITVGHFDDACAQVVRDYSNHGIPVFLACDDDIDCGRKACVQANYVVTGRIVAELMTSQLTPGSTILLCTGDARIPSHVQTVAGFDAYLKELDQGYQVLKLDGYFDETDLCLQLDNLLDSRTDIRGAFSVCARLSVLLSEEVSCHGLSDTIRVIGSDLFAENSANLARGVIRQIVYKDPEQQAYLAAKVMSNYLLKAEHPAQAVQYVESRILFRSSLALFNQ